MEGAGAGTHAQAPSRPHLSCSSTASSVSYSSRCAVSYAPCVVAKPEGAGGQAHAVKGERVDGGEATRRWRRSPPPTPAHTHTHLSDKLRCSQCCRCAHSTHQSAAEAPTGTGPPRWRRAARPSSNYERGQRSHCKPSAAPSSPPAVAQCSGPGRSRLDSTGRTPLCQQVGGWVWEGWVRARSAGGQGAAAGTGCDRTSDPCIQTRLGRQTPTHRAMLARGRLRRA